MWGSAGSRGQGKRGRSCYYHSKQRREERFSDITTTWHRSQWRQAHACMEIPPGFPLYLISFLCFLSSGWMEELCNSAHHFRGGAWNWNRQQTSAELQTFSCGKRVQFCDLVQAQTFLLLFRLKILWVRRWSIWNFCKTTLGTHLKPICLHLKFSSESRNICWHFRYRMSVQKAGI